MWKLSYKLTKQFKNADSKGPLKIAVTIKSRLEKFKIHIPLIQVICNPGLKPRHWEAMNAVLGIDITPNEDATTSLKDLLRNEKLLEKNLEALAEVSALASKEYALEQAMRKMSLDWESMAFTFVAYKDTNLFVLASFDDILALLEDHIVKTTTMKNSPFVAPFEKRVNDWLHELARMKSILDYWVKVQAAWMYLEPIFSSEDLCRQMPEEGKMFKVVHSNWLD